MKNIKSVVAVLLSTLLLLGLFVGCNAETDSQEKEDTSETVKTPVKTSDLPNNEFSVVLFTPDHSNLHWYSVQVGAQKAAQDMSVSLQWVDLDEASESAVQQAIDESVDAIIVATNTPEAIIPLLEQAKEHGIAVLSVDDTHELPAALTLTADNKNAGIKAGQAFIPKLLEDGISSGSIGIFASEENAKTLQRDTGLQEAFAATDFELSPLIVPSESSSPEETAQNLVAQGYSGLIGVDAVATEAIGKAMQTADVEGVAAMGFDRGEETDLMLAENALSLLVVQNADVIGFEAVRSAVAILNGTDPSVSVLDTGVQILT